MSLHAARKYILQEEANKLINSEQAVQDAKNKVENAGIIFIDEIDKIAAKETHGADVSREGVQRDILPIVEGCKVNTKHGMIDTAHILFIAAGAFHACKPSDLIPELQGRFPIRVELESLDAKDFVQILTAPRNALIRQYSELLSTEGVTLNFTDEAISKIANIAEEVNKRTENIGARRLHTIMELLLQDISFNAPTISGQTVPITPSYISEKLANVVQNEDLSRYVL